MLNTYFLKLIYEAFSWRWTISLNSKLNTDSFSYLHEHRYVQNMIWPSDRQCLCLPRQTNPQSPASRWCDSSVRRPTEALASAGIFGRPIFAAGAGGRAPSGRSGGHYRTGAVRFTRHSRRAVTRDVSRKTRVDIGVRAAGRPWRFPGFPPKHVRLIKC